MNEQRSESDGSIVLAGGKSSRMGEPKAWLRFGEEYLLQRIVRILRDISEHVVVVGAADQQLPPLPGAVQVVRDEIEGRGPLQGLAAGLAALEPLGIQRVFATSTDVPFLRVEFARKMLQLLEGFDVAVPYVDEHYQTLSAAYRITTLPTILELLGDNRLRPFFLYERVETRIVTGDLLAEVDPEFASLRNLNTPEEYRAALRDWDA